MPRFTPILLFGILIIVSGTDAELIPKCSYHHWPDHVIATTEIETHDTTILTNIKTTFDCEAECNKNPSCKAFSHISSTDECIWRSSRDYNMIDVKFSGETGMPGIPDPGSGLASGVKEDCDGTYVVIGDLQLSNVTTVRCPEGYFALSCQCFTEDDGGECSPRLRFSSNHPGVAFCYAYYAGKKVGKIPPGKAKSQKKIKAVVTCAERNPVTEYNYTKFSDRVNRQSPITEYSYTEFTERVNGTDPESSLRPSIGCPEHFVAPRIVGCTVYSEDIDKKLGAPRPLIDNVDVTCTPDRNVTDDTDVLLSIIVACSNEVFPWSTWSHCSPEDSTATRTREYAKPVPGSYGLETQTRPCQACDPTADIVFLLDGSGSLKHKHFDVLNNFVKLVVQTLPFGEDKIRYGLIQFSSDANVEFHLNTTLDFETLIQNIDKIPYKRGLTNSDTALNSLLNDILQEENGDRPDVQDVAVLVIDGGSTDPEATAIAADLVHNANVTVIAIGVADYNMTELQYIATEPVNETVLAVDLFSELKDKTRQFRDMICRATVEGWVDEDTVYTEWTPWSNCSESCDGGVQTRTRRCLNPTKCGTHLRETQLCNVFCCWATKHDVHFDCRREALLDLSCDQQHYTSIIRIHDVLVCTNGTCSSATETRDLLRSRCDEEDVCTTHFPCGTASTSLPVLHVLFECCYNPYVSAHHHHSHHGPRSRPRSPHRHSPHRHSPHRHSPHIPEQNTASGWPSHPHSLPPTRPTKHSKHTKHSKRKHRLGKK
ncbi:uncharacterized protein LOC106178851 [Lingula anatina]|uniref:Uncharacterized protein LOC106178851 n=1 Tax=Lingula anatina TaxID=7574 RepID=A0A1S3K5G1_LINAN|nr:uncharacterized protein LOC106178851 [Lingula anatina]|eukprot:XP_013417659.1 uncharacterized protein LOC106178851 [Lingula anatina]